MTRKARLVLLCEDSQHEAFARRFLLQRGWSLRALRVEKAPRGRGAGEQFVRRRFPVELREQRRRHVSQGLLVVIDGDTAGVSERLVGLEESCKKQHVKVWKDNEPVAIFIPTRSIETWLAYLEGNHVEEKKQYPRLAKARHCERHVRALCTMCGQGSPPQSAPPSLKEAWREYQRFRRVLP